MKGVAWRPGRPDLILRDVVNMLPAFVELAGPIAANEEQTIQHGMGRKPIGATVVRSDEALSAGEAMGVQFSREPTDINLYLKFSVGVSDGNTITLAVW